MRALLLAVILASASAAIGAPVAEHKNILLVFDEDKGFPGLASINLSLQDTFRAGLEGNVEFYSESLDISKFAAPGYGDVLVDHFRRKYASKRIDLVVAVMGPSLEFLARHGNAIFPGVPIVFCGADSGEVGRMNLGPNITGVVMSRSFAPTLDVALRLQPQARQVYVVGGASPFDLGLQSIAREELAVYDGKLKVEWLTTLSMDQLLQRVATLPPDSIVLYLTLLADGAGRSFTPHEAVARLARASSAPVYVAVDQYIGGGTVGGHVYSLTAHARHAAEAGLRVLRGEPSTARQVMASDPYRDIFDWRALRRWRLDESRLPPDSVVRFRTPTLWDQYRWYFVGGLLVLLVQTALLTALLVSRAQRRRGDLAFRDSERRRLKAELETQRQRVELSHALRVTTMGELTASMAHQLNHPLGSILLNAEAAGILLASGRLNDAGLKEMLDDIVSEADRAAQTIRRLQALFRKELGEPTLLDIEGLIAEVLALLASDLARKHVTVHFRRDGGLPMVLGDPIQLQQVILNLVVNAEEAIAAAGDGPRDVHIVTSVQEAGGIEIAVRDSGVGIDEGELSRIFEHFVTSKPQGLGMGLAISRSILDAHGGLIWATRNEDRGLTMHVQLPVPVQPERSGPRPDASSEPAEPRRERDAA